MPPCATCSACWSPSCPACLPSSSPSPLLTALGVLLSFLLRKALTAARFDERLQNRATSIADWSPQHSPTALVGRIAFWGCVVLGLVIGILSVNASYATGSVLTMSLLPYLTHAIGAVLLFFAGNLIARFLARTVLIGAVNNQLQYARFLSMGVKWLVLVLTAAMVLDHLGIGGTIVELAFGILFGGIVLTLALAIGLGSRELVSRSLQRAEKTEKLDLFERAPGRRPLRPRALRPTHPPHRAQRNPPPLLVASFPSKRSRASTKKLQTRN